MRRILFYTLGLVTFVGCTREPIVTVLTVETQPRQTIKGWGIYPCTIQNDRPHAADYTLWQRPNAARLIWKDLGISFWRSEILPGSYDSIKNDGSLNTRYLDESLVRQIRLADQYGQKPYFLSVWSPPAAFKDPVTTLGIDPKTKRRAHLRLDREDAYCRYIVRVFDYLIKTRKLPAPFAFSLQNEPNYASPLWNGTPYSPEQWQRVLKKMRRALDSGGYGKVSLIGPEGGSYADSVAFLGGAKAAALQKDSEFSHALGGFAFHGYTVLSKRQSKVDELLGVAQIAARLKKDIWMSEYSITALKRTPMEHALETLQRLGRETATLPCNYWAWWQGYYPQDPKNEVLITGQDDNALYISKTFRVLQKLWHSAPAGNVVHLVESSDANIRGHTAEAVQTVAFEHGSRTTLLVINPTWQAKSLELRGLIGTAAVPNVTDETVDMKELSALPIKSGTVRMTLGGHSILVLVTR